MRRGLEAIEDVDDAFAVGGLLGWLNMHGVRATPIAVDGRYTYSFDIVAPNIGGKDERFTLEVVDRDIYEEPF